MAREPPPCVCELPHGTIAVAELMPVAGGGEVVQATEISGLAGIDQLERLGQRARRREELVPLEVRLGVPAIARRRSARGGHSSSVASVTGPASSMVECPSARGDSRASAHGPGSMDLVPEPLD